MSEQTFIIVGASLAGAKAAAELRERGFDGRVVLIGSEPQRPYQRPPLSKSYLRGDAGLDEVYVHDESFYADQAIELRTATTVERIEPGSSEVVLGSGERLHYERLLLTTGLRPAGCRFPEPSCRRSITCAASRSPIGCVSGSAAAAAWWLSGRAGSAVRWRRRPARWVWT